MIAKLFRTGLLIAAIAVAGCTGADLDQLSAGGGAKAEKQLSPKILASMKSKGMTRTSPVMARIFKEEGKLEIWKQKTNGRYEIITSYDICKWSGKLGPKYVEGDRQAPEGFYTVRPAQMNPRSSYHLAFNIGYPNEYDRHHGRTGTFIMIHGNEVSLGCLAMTDPKIEEIYTLCDAALRGGQKYFRVHLFPFRMTTERLEQEKDNPWHAFWLQLKEGYDHFEREKTPPEVTVELGRYRFK